MSQMKKNANGTSGKKKVSMDHARCNEVGESHLTARSSRPTNHISIRESPRSDFVSNLGDPSAIPFITLLTRE